MAEKWRVGRDSNAQRAACAGAALARYADRGAVGPFKCVFVGEMAAQVGAVRVVRAVAAQEEADKDGKEKPHAGVSPRGVKRQRRASSGVSGEEGGRARTPSRSPSPAASSPPTSGRCRQQIRPQPSQALLSLCSCRLRRHLRWHPPDPLSLPAPAEHLGPLHLLAPDGERSSRAPSIRATRSGTSTITTAALMVTPAPALPESSSTRTSRKTARTGGVPPRPPREVRAAELPELRALSGSLSVSISRPLILKDACPPLTSLLLYS